MIEPDFFDTNILLYAEIDDGTQKHQIAKELVKKTIVSGDPHINAQVINEFTVNVHRAGKALPEVETIVNEFLENFTAHPLAIHICQNAFRITRRYAFSFWDSLIVAAALDAGCTTLYTEDLQDGQIIDGILTVRNPFVTKNEEGAE
ncbi:MAG: PIN domain-containing protein [Tannerella sp.]|jgi:predicted nucleic acid-binding protein|nr:PIN domain-containing protein [Tannerella sp.]